MERISVLLADDHPVVRQGLRTLLELQDDIELVGEAADGAEAVAGAEELLPDVVLIDLVMPELDGVEALIRETLDVGSSEPEPKRPHDEAENEITEGD